MGKNKKQTKILAENKNVSEKTRNNIILILIVAYTFLLFAKSINYPFVNWDDNSYILNNPLIRDISFKGIKDIFSTPVIGMYNPLTFLVYALEYHFWGMDPHGYHLVNIIFHLLATITIFKFIYELTKRYEAAAIVALLFAIHPMHVSVVTWVSETKTSMYVFFYALGLVNYIKYVRLNYQNKYLIYSGLLFLLAVLSKPSAVTFPVLLLLIDYYLSRKLDKRLVIEKIPFFLISLFFGVLTILTHSEAGDSIFESEIKYSLINNILVSNYSVAFYINKVFFPLDLSTIYGYPRNLPWLSLKYYFSLLTIPTVLWLIYKAGSFRKEMIFGTLYFIISISILLRFVPSGFFRASNVYTYMSYTGFFFIVAQVVIYTLDNKLPYARKIKPYVLIFICSLIAFYTWRTTISIKIWENSITLFDDVIKNRPRIPVAYNNRGVSKAETGDQQGAIQDFTKAIALYPEYASAYNNRGKILIDLKEYENAILDLNIAVKLEKNYTDAYVNRGNALFFKMDYNRSLKDYNTALRLNPRADAVYRNRSKIRIINKDTIGALSDLNHAILLNPQFIDAYIDRGNIMYNKRLYDKAIDNYTKIIQINPNYIDAYNNRAAARMMQKDTIAANTDIQKINFLRNNTASQTRKF